MAVSEKDMARQIYRNIVKHLGALENNETRMWVSYGVALALLTESELLGVCSEKLAMLFAKTILERNLTLDDSKKILERVQIELEEMRCDYDHLI